MNYPDSIKTVGQKIAYLDVCIDNVYEIGHTADPSTNLDRLNQCEDERTQLIEDLQHQMLNYGDCPSCGKSCQPPDTPEQYDNDFLKDYCFCCDCKLEWMILIPNEALDEESHLRKYQVVDVEPFGIVSPYGC